MLASLSGKGPMVRYPAMVRTAKTTPARGTSRASRLLPLMVVPPFVVADPSDARRRAGGGGGGGARRVAAPHGGASFRGCGPTRRWAAGGGWASAGRAIFAVGQ